MDSQMAINNLITLRTQKQQELDALTVAIDLLTNGFQSDTVRINIEIQKIKDSYDARLAANMV